MVTATGTWQREMQSKASNTHFVNRETGLSILIEPGSVPDREFIAWEQRVGNLSPDHLVRVTGLLLLDEYGRPYWELGELTVSPATANPKAEHRRAVPALQEQL
jgi:hypothetical protein